MFFYYKSISQTKIKMKPKFSVPVHHDLRKSFTILLDTFFGHDLIKQAQAGNSMRHLRDIRRGVTDRRTDGQVLL